jgi:polysaccharide biosynthesis/export protein
MKMASRRVLFVIICFCSVVLSESCKNRAIMFRTPRDFKFDDFNQVATEEQYKIGLNDLVEITLSTNKGAGELENVGVSDNGIVVRQKVTVTVEYDGTIKIPILGRIYLKDLSLREAELLMEEKYKLIFIDPYVVIRIINKRVILFPGEGGAAKVITLTNQNTSLIEALALSGGISANGKAHKVKLVRGDLKNPKVYLINLSTIEGLKAADLTLQGNDIIYVQPRDEYVTNFVNRISGIVVLATTLFFIYNLIPKS